MAKHTYSKLTAMVKRTQMNSSRFGMTVRNLLVFLVIEKFVEMANLGLMSRG